MSTVQTESLFSETSTGQIVVERAEDEIKRVIAHYQDMAVDHKKPSKVKLEITILPNERRDHFYMDIAAGCTLAPVKSHQSDLFASVDRDKRVSVVEVRQNAMFEGE